MMRRLIFPLFLVLLTLFLASWGSKAHRKISREMPLCLPAEMAFLIPAWTDYVTDHSMDPDYRKNSDPSESAKHYIDIDNYPEFNASGTISTSYDSVILQHGFPFVWEQGILPWAIITTYDSLVKCFERRDWNRSAHFAADLAHYVGDGHMPLHITRNYNGQYTGNNGIHSRYETSMISRYESQLVYSADPAEYIQDVTSFVFGFIYVNHHYVDSILLADDYARMTTGSSSSSAYYNALWLKTGAFTNDLLRRASFSLASLIYTAWINAGKPELFPNGNEEMTATAWLLKPFPNPATDVVNIPVVVHELSGAVELTIYRMDGSVVLAEKIQSPALGMITLRKDVASWAPGSYICVLQTVNGYSSVKMVISPHHSVSATR